MGNMGMFFREKRFFCKKYCVFPIPSFEIRTNLLCEQTDIWK